MASPLKKLPHRKWVRLRDQWLGYIPSIDFGIQYPSPTLWELPQFGSTLGSSKAEGAVPYVTGVREAIFREAIILARKFEYCWSVAHIAASQGKQTWTSMAAYEASFYGAKSFCYMLGFASLGRDSKFYVDAFHETTIKVGKKKVTDLELMIYNLSSRLEHSTLWGIMERLLNTAYFSDNLADLQDQLRKINWLNYSVFRNRVMYAGAFWPFSNDSNFCDVTRAFCHPDVLAALDPLQDVSSPFAPDYFVVAKLIKNVLHLMLADIATLASALGPEAQALAK